MQYRLEVRTHPTEFGVGRWPPDPPSQGFASFRLDSYHHPDDHPTPKGEQPVDFDEEIKPTGEEVPYVEVGAYTKRRDTKGHALPPPGRNRDHPRDVGQGSSSKSRFDMSRLQNSKKEDDPGREGEVARCVGCGLTLNSMGTSGVLCSSCKASISMREERVEKVSLDSARVAV